ncbi:hypothetical protein ABIC56_001041 [Acinetobacter bereziniae]|uniref:hypothetical protein n=1 Tax=Acinetobacter bereziniae TaxID=106648 RepID=UPI00286037BE|nr:hypothetical protein [Acinetobacter bereziniae]MDR6540497.1 hypothetical protein [Acinetobacter bereziniae]
MSFYFYIFMINTTYTIKADPIKIIAGYVILTTLQIPCYLYIAHSDYITFTFIFVVLLWLFILLFELVALYLLIKYGRPLLCFHSDFCQIQMPAINITVDYEKVSALSMRKIQQEHRGFSFGMCYELELSLSDQIMQQHALRKKPYPVKNLFLSSNFLFKNNQILEIAIIFSALARKKASKRVESILQLQQHPQAYESLISEKDLENFKNNQYIYKLFKFGQ